MKIVGEIITAKIVGEIITQGRGGKGEQQFMASIGYQEEICLKEN